MCLEHKVELADIGKIGLAATEAGTIVVADVCKQCFAIHSLDVHAFDVVFLDVFFNKLVSSVTHFARLTVDKRVVKGSNVTGSNPYLAVHEDSCIKTYVVGILLNKLFPPCVLYVVLKLNTQRTVVPGVCKTAIDLGTGEYKSACFTKRNEFVHCLFCVFHSDISPFLPDGLPG